MIYRGSRYTQTKAVPSETGSNTYVFERRDLAEFTFKDCKSHIWTEGDTIDGVSFKYYGSTQYWWVIMDANVKYVFPTDIQVGDVLVIPSISEVLTKI